VNSSPYLLPAFAFLAAVLAGCVTVAAIAVIARTPRADAD